MNRTNNDRIYKMQTLNGFITLPRNAPVLINRYLWSLIALLLFWFQGAQAASIPNQRTMAFVHANLIPMTSATIRPDHTVIVADGRITVVGPSSETKIPSKATVINCQDTFLMPGLADMHMHLRYNWKSDIWPVSPLKLYLANGVTTIRCFGPRGKTGRYALEWRKESVSSKLIGPRILTCGPQLRGHFQEDPSQIVIRQKAQHFDFLKIYAYVTRQEYKMILSMAKKLNMYTAGHIPFQVGLDGVLKEGMDEIAHIEELLWEFSNLDRQSFFKNENEWMTYAIQTTFRQLGPLLELPPHEQERNIEAMVTTIVEKLKNKSIPFCTTLVIDDLIVQKLYQPEEFLRRPENRYLPPGYLERFRNGLEKHQQQFKGGEAFAPLKYLLDKKLLSALKAIKSPLLLSTDSGTGTMGIVPGFSLHDELRILVANGFSPYEALAAGTVVASKIVERMNGQDDFGTIVPGKRADLILLEQNPLEDVANARKIRGVMATGRWYDKKAIGVMLAQ